jgi:hypothetical protein
MQRWAWVAAIAALLAGTPAGATNVGIGLAGGASFALAQSDNGNGGLLALRVPVNVTTLFTVEPFLSYAAHGSTAATFGDLTYTRRGLDVFSGGAILALGGVGMTPRFPIYPFLGAGAFHLSRDGSRPDTQPGYLVGVGYARGLPGNCSMQARADYNWVTVDGASRQFFELSIGVSMRLYPGPQEGL